MNGFENELTLLIFSQSIIPFMASAPKNEDEKGAIDNSKELANGNEFFVRLPAFDDDKRIDKVNRRLRPGSYTIM